MGYNEPSDHTLAVLCKQQPVTFVFFHIISPNSPSHPFVLFSFCEPFLATILAPSFANCQQVCGKPVTTASGRVLRPEAGRVILLLRDINLPK